MGRQGRSKTGDHKQIEQQPLPERDRGLQELCSKPLTSLILIPPFHLKQGILTFVSHLLTLLVLLLLLTPSKGGREEGRGGMGGEDRDICSAGSSSLLRGVGHDEAEDGKFHRRRGTGGSLQGGEGDEG